MDFYLDTLLCLPKVTVECCQKLEEYVCLHLNLLNGGINCPHCQCYTEEIHQDRPILVRDLSICGQAVYLKIPRRQFECTNCGRYTTELLDFVENKRRHTKRYEKYIYQRVATGSIQEVCREEGLKYDEVKAMFDGVSKQHQKKLGNQLSA